MSAEELVYTGEYSVGDRVTVTVDNEDGSWVGENGTVIHTYRQKGGVFAPERNVTVVVPDIEDIDGLAESKEGLVALRKKHEDDDGYFLTSDEFEFEATDE